MVFFIQFCQFKIGQSGTDDDALFPSAIKFLFDECASLIAKGFTMRVFFSVVEIYLEKIIDCLGGEPGHITKPRHLQEDFPEKEFEVTFCFRTK